MKDLVVLGHVRTLDARGTIAEALAIRDGRMLAVGSAEQARAAVAPDAPVHDHRGRTIVPGFNDAHAHLDSLGLIRMRPSLQSADSIEAVLRKVRDLARTTPAGEWIVTMPVGQGPFYFEQPNHLRERRLPNRHELDEAAPEHPVYLSAPSGYWGTPPCYSSLNSRALAANGIDRHTKPRIPGIEIERDERGEPTGIIVDHNYLESAQLDLLPAVPRFSRSQRREAIRIAQASYHAVGTTSIYEGHGMAPQMLGHYRALHEQGLLTMRTGLVVNPLLRDVGEADRMFGDWLSYAAGQGLGDGMLRISGVYLAFGGDRIGATIAARSPDDMSWSSYVRQAWTEEEFERLALAAAACGLRVHTVAADGIERLLPVLERIAARRPLKGLRWVIEHIGACTEEAVRRIARLGVGVTLIPAFHVWKSSGRYRDADPAVQAMVAPARALMAAGVPVAVGTDAVPHNPLMNVWAMATRRSRVTGAPLGEAGRVDVDSALRLATVAGAWLTFEEHSKGPLAPGFQADLAVLSEDPCEIDPDRIPEIRCEATWVGGRQVHGPDGAYPPDNCQKFVNNPGLGAGKREE